jgi:hypothetical protein
MQGRWRSVQTLLNKGSPVKERPFGASPGVDRVSRKSYFARVASTAILAPSACACASW